MSDMRLGVVGVDGSHCQYFSRIINGENDSGARVLFYWSAGDSERERDSAKVLEALGVEPVARPEDLLGKIDAVLVLPYNHARDNYPLAHPFLNAGLPTYVDKVLSLSILEAKRMVALAQERNVPLISDSALRYVSEVAVFRRRRSQVGNLVSGAVAGPGDVTRYGHHTIRMMQGVFGEGIDWVSSSRDHVQDVATVRYRDGRTVTLFLHREMVKRGWRFIYFGENETGYVEIDITDVYRNLVYELVAVLKGSRPGPTGSELLETVAVAEAMRQSAANGQRVFIEGLLAEQDLDD